MNQARRILSYLKENTNWRQVVAYFLMFIFIITPSVGAWMIYPPAGWVTFGVLSGVVGYILGAD